MKAGLKRAFYHLERLFYPPRCACCNRVVGQRELVCEDCASVLPRITGPVCLVCGREKEFCGESHAMEFARCVAPFYYLEPVRQGIHGLKFEGHKKSAEYFSLEMAETVRQRLNGVCFDLVIPVPLSDKRLAERGYNQSALLAAGVAERLGLYFSSETLYKLFDNRPQHSLTREERRGNVLGVYEAVGERVRDKTILLVDDIATTGSTLNECVKMLRLRGCREVYALTACIALRDKDMETVRQQGRFSSCISTVDTV